MIVIRGSGAAAAGGVFARSAVASLVPGCVAQPGAPQAQTPAPATAPNASYGWLFPDDKTVSAAGAGGGQGQEAHGGSGRAHSSRAKKKQKQN